MAGPDAFGEGIWAKKKPGARTGAGGMTKTDFPAAILSRPTYGVLESRPGPAHLMIADGDGAGAGSVEARGGLEHGRRST